MTGEEWASIIDSASDAGLVWYSTVTQKPVARQPPSSVIDAALGTDLGRAGSTGSLSSGVLVLALAVIVAVVLMKS